MRKLLTLAGTFLFLSMVVVSCDDQPTSPDQSSSAVTGAAVAPATSTGAHQASSSGVVHSRAPFSNWYQGFNHGTDGWYGAETAGALGWCGQIGQVAGRGGSIAPSAGRGYATVSQGTCNTFYDDEFSFPGVTLVGAPWAPGPNFAALFRPWPDAGYVMELDIYLDPAYEAVGPEEGTYVFEFPTWKGAVFGYSVSFATLDDGAFHYLWTPVMSGVDKLLVGGGEYEVTEAGWYTFRYVFNDDGGALAVDFELAKRRGGTVHTESLDALFYAPSLSPADFLVSNVGTGYAWFTSISRGLTLPIDEYHVRQGN